MNWVGLLVLDGYVQLPGQMSIWKGQGPPKRHLADVDENIAVVFGFAPKSYEDCVHRLLTNPANDRVGKPHKQIVEVDNLQERLDRIDPQVAPLICGRGV